VTLVPLGGSLEQRQTVSYVPGTDLVERTATYGPPMNGRGAQTLWVRSEYDPEGNPTVMERWSDPDPSGARIGRIRTSWRYDAAGRAVAELAPGSGTFTETLYRDECNGTTEVDGCTQVPYDTTYTVEHKDSTLYDPAGNPVEVHTRRTNPATGAPLVIRMKYDALNRLQERVVPQVHYSRARDHGIPRYYRESGAAHCTGEMPERTYPSRPNDGGCGYRIEEDVQTFRYDAMGNVTRADNRDAQVRRRYNQNGTLQIDSLRIRSSDSAGFSRHEYGLEFRYDLNGRRTELQHPAQLAPSPAQTKVSYGYDPVTGALDRVTDPLGNVFQYEYNLRGELHRKVFAGAAWDEYEYDVDGAITGHSTFRLEEQVPGENFRRFEYLRRTEIARDAQGRLKQASNMVGRRDTITTRYSGLGHLVRTTASIYGDTTTSPTFLGSEGFTYDALGNVAADTAFQSVRKTDVRKETRSERTSGYVEGTGQLSWISGTVTQHVVAPLQPTFTVNRREAYAYDAGGNLEFSTQSYRSSGSCSSARKEDADCEDRVSFYAADGTLRAAEHRVRMGEDNNGYWRDAFEEYRYDALGRLVWVRSHVICPEGTPTSGFPFVPCYSAVRRTVWDGNAELWEIQMPGEDGYPYLENDTALVPVRPYNSWVPAPPSTGSTAPPPAPDENYSRFDPNPRYGRVAYTYGLGVDQPLSVVRIGLSRYYAAEYQQSSGQGVTFAPFAAMPLTDWRGHVDGAVYAGGAKQHCQTFSGTDRCTSAVMGQAWSAYGHEDPSVLEWHGTLPTGKRDATGTLYRRARYYDPQTGRFTQEDPIGLAGGLNLYGYADGDPINLSDPSGLCPWCIGAVIGGATGAAYYYLTTPPSQRSWQGALQYTLAGAVVGGTMGYGLGLVAAADAAAGGTAVARGTGFVGELAVKAYYPAAGAAAVSAGKTGEAAVHRLVDIGQ
jgi:RHS repeat-associated protein